MGASIQDFYWHFFDQDWFGIKGLVTETEFVKSLPLFETSPVTWKKDLLI